MIKLWSDRLCGNIALIDLFPSVFRLSREKEASVAASLATIRKQNSWNINFIRVAHDWEIGTLMNSFTLYSLQVWNRGSDSLWWVPIGKNQSLVRSFYKSLARPHHCEFLWKKIWHNKAPSTTLFFA